jgi:hypothetical protein
MSPPSVTLGDEARGRLDAHLDRIEACLHAAGIEREARRSITEDVEGQVLDTLAARFGLTPDAAQVDAVLAEMDPPEAYVADAQGAPSAEPTSPARGPDRPTKRRLSRTALVGALWAPLVTIPAVLAVVFVGGARMTVQAEEEQHREVIRQMQAEAERQAELDRERLERESGTTAEEAPAATETSTIEVATEVKAEPVTWLGIPAFLMSLPGLAAPFGTTLCGIIAIVQIRSSKGRLRGMGLAIFDTALFPSLAALGLLVVPVAFVAFERHARREMVIEEVAGATGRHVAPVPKAPVEWPVSEGGNGHRYVRTPEPCTWAEAAAQAEAVGGHLVTISSQAENDWVWRTFGGPDHSLWIGLSDLAEEGTWVWTNGEPVTYTNWDVGEPNNLGGEDYGQLFMAGTWNDTNQHDWRNPVYGLIEIEPALGLPPDAESNDARTGPSSGGPLN